MYLLSSHLWFWHNLKLLNCLQPGVAETFLIERPTPHTSEHEDQSLVDVLEHVAFTVMTENSLNKREIIELLINLPSVVGASHNQTRQQLSGSCTNLAFAQIAVSMGGGRFSCGHRDEQACLPFWNLIFFYSYAIRISLDLLMMFVDVLRVA